MNFIIDLLKKGLDASKHPGIGNPSLFALVYRALPYLTSFTGYARPPMTVYININSECNLHCKMCDVGTMNEASNFYKNLRIDKKSHELSLERFCTLIDEVEHFRPLIAINGTEPLIYKPLVRAVTYARKKGLRVSVTTNGYNLPEQAEALAVAGLTRLNVSIDGPPLLHNDIRGRKDVFERATSGIVMFWEAARKQGYTPEILINCTVTNLNYSRLLEFYDSISTLPVGRVNFVNMSFVTEEMAQDHNRKWSDKYPATVNCLSGNVQPDLVNVELLYRQVEAVRKKGGKRVCFLPLLCEEQLKKYFYRPMEFMKGTPCMSSWFIVQIMADGEVIPYTRCYHIPLGNVNEQSFLEIWNGMNARAWRRDLRKNGRFPACSRCDMVC